MEESLRHDGHVRQEVKRQREYPEALKTFEVRVHFGLWLKRVTCWSAIWLRWCRIMNIQSCYAFHLKWKILYCPPLVPFEEHSAHAWQAATSAQRPPIILREWGLWYHMLLYGTYQGQSRSVLSIDLGYGTSSTADYGELVYQDVSGRNTDLEHSHRGARPLVSNSSSGHNGLGWCSTG